MFVEWRYIFLGWVLYNLHDTIGMNDGVMNELCSPSVAVFNACEINSIAFLYFTHEDTITDDYSVHCVV
jgi:hypothetical protein